MAGGGVAQGWSQAKLMDALKQGRDLGLVNAVGVSNYKADQLEEAHGILDKLGLPLVSNQVRYNLLNRAPEKQGLSKVAEERGVKLVAYAPYAEGQLVGKTDDAKVRDGWRADLFGMVTEGEPHCILFPLERLP